VPVLTLVGVGIDPLRHASAEALSVTRDAETVFYLGALSPFFAAIGRTDGISLNHLYRDGDLDINNYERIVQFLLQSVRNGDCALVVEGHPHVGVTLRMLLDATAERDVIVKSVAGISSLDTALIDCRFDLLDPGTQVVDVNRLLLFRYALETRLNAVIYHVSSVAESRTFYNDPVPSNSVHLLQDYLLKLFPKDHVVTVFSSRTSQSGSGWVNRHELKNLHEAAPSLDYSTSLFVPALRRFSVDQSFLSRVPRTS
jgi:uncharacterized protein YabN with tetrapyrrole methylase and pyrophosphatase domain